MACYHPIAARLVSGGLRLRVHPTFATHYVGCGKCIGCREQQALNWTIRLKHETRSHSHNTFLTLTYADEETPELSIPHLQKFWKRLRKVLPNKIKYFGCGEYGDRTHRAHYHAAIFGMQQFPDSKKWDTENTVSETLNEIWSHGRVLQSELTPARIAYVTGYVLKKAGYKKQIYCDEDGVDMQPPFRKMSQGLGKDWLAKYGTDLRMGYVKNEDYKTGIPRYYTEKLKETQPELAETIQNAKDEARMKMDTPNRERCKAGEIIRHQQIKKHRREKI